MTDQKFAQQAAIECSSAATAAHIGGGEGRPFWNPEATQFMYVPAFQFQPYPGCGKYRYAITDSEGREHSFESRSSGASLEPVWKDIPEGVTELRVFATDAEGKDAHLPGPGPFSGFPLSRRICRGRRAATARRRRERTITLSRRASFSTG